MNKIKWLLLLTVLVLSGCEKAENLESSVNSRWQAIIENDYEKAYSYFSPGYREVESLESFKIRMLTAKININWTAGTFKEALCKTEGVCEVKAEVVYSYSFPKRSLGGVKNIPSEIKEDWLKLDGKWFHVPKKD